VEQVEQVHAMAMEDSEHLPVRERLKNLASSTGAAGRLAKCKRDMEEAGMNTSSFPHRCRGTTRNAIFFFFQASTRFRQENTHSTRSLT